MAKLSIDPPKQFNFGNPDDWPRWNIRFQQFREASDILAKSEKCQVSTLFYCLGKDTDYVLVSTNVTEDERKRYKDVMAKFDHHFKIHHNLIFKQAKFNKRVQLVVESLEQYM